MRYRVFDELQAARDALKKSCDDFAAELSGSKHSIFKPKGKSAMLMANEKMLQLVNSDFDDVSAMVYGIESQWKEKHSNVSTYRNTSCRFAEILRAFTDTGIFRSINFLPKFARLLMLIKKYFKFFLVKVYTHQFSVELYQFLSK